MVDRRHRVRLPGEESRHRERGDGEGSGANTNGTSAQIEANGARTRVFSRRCDGRWKFAGTELPRRHHRPAETGIMGGEPHGVHAACGVFRHERSHREPVDGKEPLILRRAETRVVQCLVAPGADRLAFRGAAREQQRRTLPSMCGESGQHLPLVIHIQMEGSCRRRIASRSPAQFELTHVSHKPFGVGKAHAAERDHGRRRIHANHAKPAIDEVSRDRLAHPAAQVEDGAPGAHVGQRPIQPAAFLKRSAAVSIVDRRMSFVQIDDGLVAPGRWMLRCHDRGFLPAHRRVAAGRRAAGRRAAGPRLGSDRLTDA